MATAPSRLIPLLALAVALNVLAACATSGGTVPPASSVPRPPSVSSPEDAASLVIASDPRFKGAIQSSPGLVGAAKTWTAAAAEGGYTVSITVGWGDCPAGCISHHVWTYRVGADGSIDVVGESGDPVPASLAP